MTKKDYILIANCIGRTLMVADMEKNSTKKLAKRWILALAVTDLSATLGSENPKFDSKRFMTACGFGAI